ncbi:DUF742 domain-containing protein [Actinoallomurus sp. NPDC052274]|uniref:DUF742 domain-containing protein n=1 Tax=Actinoallomurus sp. NPDC052274 TaxID=3155420 RepID=UPI00342F3806
MTAPWVRPYVLARGRTSSRQRLYLHTLICAPSYDSAAAARLLPEARALYERAHAGTGSGAESIAELAARCRLSLAVTFVLLGDLLERGLVRTTRQTYNSPRDPRLLMEVLDGLHALR